MRSTMSSSRSRPNGSNAPSPGRWSAGAAASGQPQAMARRILGPAPFGTAAHSRRRRVDRIDAERDYVRLHSGMAGRSSAAPDRFWARGAARSGAVHPPPPFDRSCGATGSPGCATMAWASGPPNWRMAARSGSAVPTLAGPRPWPGADFCRKCWHPPAPAFEPKNGPIRGTCPYRAWNAATAFAVHGPAFCGERFRASPVLTGTKAGAKRHPQRSSLFGKTLHRADKQQGWQCPERVPRADCNGDPDILPARVANFALHKAALETRHPLLEQLLRLLRGSGGWFGLAFEFFLLLGAMHQAGQDPPAGSGPIPPTARSTPVRPG